jgi:phosphatidylglycerophosphatase B
MTALIGTPQHDQKNDPSRTLRPPPSVAAMLAGSFVALLVTDAAPAIELDSWLALAAWAVSGSSGFAGTPVVLGLGIAWLASCESFRGKRLVISTLVLTVLLVVLGAASFANQRLLKPAVAATRPHIRELARLGIIPPANDYDAIGDQKHRTKDLRHLFQTQPAAALLPKLHPLIREHWVTKTNHSFPSGHTLAAFLLATTFTLLGSHLEPRLQQLARTFLPWAVLVGWSRTLLRVHSTADVAVGALLGIALGCLAAWIIAKTITWHTTKTQTLNQQQHQTTI